MRSHSQEKIGLEDSRPSPIHKSPYPPAPATAAASIPSLYPGLGLRQGQTRNEVLAFDTPSFELKSHFPIDPQDGFGDH